MHAYWLFIAVELMNVWIVLSRVRLDSYIYFEYPEGSLPPPWFPFVLPLYMLLLSPLAGSKPLAGLYLQASI